jgi:hypothetical protein
MWAILPKWPNHKHLKGDDGQLMIGIAIGIGIGIEGSRISLFIDAQFQYRFRCNLHETLSFAWFSDGFVKRSSARLAKTDEYCLPHPAMTRDTRKADIGLFTRPTIK